MVTGYFYWHRYQGEITKPWKAALEHAWHQWEWRRYKAAMRGCDGKALICSDIFGKAALAKQPCKLKPELKDRDRDREYLLGRRLLITTLKGCSLHWFYKLHPPSQQHLKINACSKPGVLDTVLGRAQ